MTFTPMEPHSASLCVAGGVLIALLVAIIWLIPWNLLRPPSDKDSLIFAPPAGAPDLDWEDLLHEMLITRRLLIAMLLAFATVIVVAATIVILAYAPENKNTIKPKATFTEPANISRKDLG